MTNTITLMTATVVKIDNTSDALVDVSSNVETAQVTIRMTNAEYSTFASEWANQTYGVLPKGAMVNIKFARTTEDDELANIIDEWIQGSSTGLKTIECYDPDTTTGSREITGEVALKSPGDWMNKDASSGAEQAHTIQLGFHGAPTFSVVAGS